MTPEFVWAKTDADNKPVVSKQEAEEVMVLENLVASTKKKFEEKRQKMKTQQKNPMPGPITRPHSANDTSHPQRVLEHARRANEAQNKCITAVEESAWAKEVVQTATRAENPFLEQGDSVYSQISKGDNENTYRNHLMIIQSSDSECRPNESTSAEPVVQTIAADCPEPQSKRSTSVKDPVSVAEVILEMPIVRSTRKLSSVSPNNHRNVEELVKTKQTTHPDPATTVAFVEKEEEGGEAEILTAKAAERTDSASEARKVEDASYELFRPLSTRIRAMHLKISSRNPISLSN